VWFTVHNFVDGDTRSPNLVSVAIAVYHLHIFVEVVHAVYHLLKNVEVVHAPHF
jgi:hypothetical protein